MNEMLNTLRPGFVFGYPLAKDQLELGDLRTLEKLDNMLDELQERATRAACPMQVSARKIIISRECLHTFPALAQLYIRVNIFVPTPYDTVCVSLPFNSVKEHLMISCVLAGNLRCSSISLLLSFLLILLHIAVSKTRPATNNAQRTAHYLPSKLRGLLPR